MVKLWINGVARKVRELSGSQFFDMFEEETDR